MFEDNQNSITLPGAIAMGTGVMIGAGILALRGQMAELAGPPFPALLPLIHNTAGVPVAAGALFPFFGILISPMFAAFAMSGSSISVALNSLRLRRATV